MKHVLSIVVNNSFGVLSRVTNLFARRGFNIDSLSVGETTDPTYSVIMISALLSDDSVTLLKKQLYKLVDVIEVNDLTGEAACQRELVLTRVQTRNPEERNHLFSLAIAFGAKVIDTTTDTIAMEIVGLPRTVDSFIKVLAEYKMVSIARTGVIAVRYM